MIRYIILAITLMFVAGCAERPANAGVKSRPAKEIFLDHCVHKASMVPFGEDFDNYDMAGAIRACGDAADKVYK